MAITDENETTECAYCHYDVPDEGEWVPDKDDDAEWDRLAALHGDDCEWIATRAHWISE